MAGMKKAELEAKIELLKAEVAGIERVEEANYKLKKKVASLSYKLKEQREYTHAAQAEVERLRDLIGTVIRNCMECYDKRECQSCAWLREGTEKKP